MSDAGAPSLTKRLSAVGTVLEAAHEAEADAEWSAVFDGELSVCCATAAFTTGRATISRS